jgi:multidrug efflux pump subunit AcrB
VCSSDLVFDGAIAHFITGMENGYARLLRFALRNRFIMLVLAFSLFLLAVQQLSTMGMNLMPQSTTDDQVNITLTLPTGTNTQVTRQYLFEFQEIIQRELPREAYKNLVLSTGTSNSGSLQLTLPKLKDQTMNPAAIRAALTPFLREWSDVTVSFSAGRGPGSGSNRINIELVSDDTAAATIVANEIVSLLKTRMDGKLTDVATDIENGSPRYEITIDTDAAAAAGVSVSAISSLMKTAITGSTATTYHVGGQDIDIIVALEDGALSDPTDIGGINVATSNGLMRLDNFIRWKESKSPMQIQREEGVRLNHVTANLVPGTTITEMTAAVQELLEANIVLPDTVRMDFGGDSRDIGRFTHVFLLIIALAVFLVFAVMAAQFESLVDPLIIFCSIPLLLIGVVGIYLLKDQTLSLYSLVGIVALVGIVVNNGIVLVDFTNQLVNQKMPVIDACIEAGRNRLQPILMTTITTVLGMVPIAFFPGEGAAQMQPLCLTITGGLLSGAFMTLFVSPILYSLFNKRREKRFNDPESLLNQMIELDAMDKSKVKIIKEN